MLSPREHLLRARQPASLRVPSNPAPQSPASKYRLVVAIKYEARIAFIRFVGTHAAYDRIDVEKV